MFSECFSHVLVMENYQMRMWASSGFIPGVGRCSILLSITFNYKHLISLTQTIAAQRNM